MGETYSFAFIRGSHEQHIFRRVGHNRVRLAESLGISVRCVRNRLKRYEWEGHIQPPPRPSRDTYRRKKPSAYLKHMKSRREYLEELKRERVAPKPDQNS
jgi:hypothetical protein